MGLAARGAGRENVGMGQASGVGNSGAMLREYMTHLRVEKGLRPLSCEAYLRDLEMFAEFLEGGGAGGVWVQTFQSAEQGDVSGFMQQLREHGVVEGQADGFFGRQLAGVGFELRGVLAALGVEEGVKLARAVAGGLVVDDP